MSISYSEYLKNKNTYNNLLSQNIKTNSFIKVVSGNSSNSGTIKDLSFYNSKNTIDKINKDKENREKGTSVITKDFSNNIINAIGAPYYVSQSLNNILNSTKKATNTIKSIFDSLF